MDQRSTIAKARDDYFVSDEGKRNLDGEAKGQYLQNRLELAFLAGYHAAERALVDYAQWHAGAKMEWMCLQSSLPKNQREMP